MKIKNGYANQPFEIRIDGDGEKIAHVYTVMAEHSLPRSIDGRKEVLHYATLDEIIELRDECNAAIKDMTGL